MTEEEYQDCITKQYLAAASWPFVMEVPRISPPMGPLADAVEDLRLKVRQLQAMGYVVRMSVENGHRLRPVDHIRVSVDLPKKSLWQRLKAKLAERRSARRPVTTRR